jgi:hypothetical protein
VHTPGHALVNTAVLGGCVEPRLELAVIAGALLPDLPIIVLYLRERARRTDEDTIWRVVYQRRAWLAMIHAAHSLVIAGALLGAGVLLGWAWLVAFAASLGLHDLADLPVHAEDAHRHFFPLSDWRFVSPVSYWDPARHGAQVAALEVLGAWAAAVVVWRRGLGPIGLTAVAAIVLWYPWRYWRAFLRARRGAAA